MPNVERNCPTCGKSKAADAFYRNCSECKGCKKKRSRNARLVQARKLAAFERFLTLLADLSTGAPNPTRPLTEETCHE